LCANVNGRIMPLDTSHGKAPGWMVPRDRINRFQTWTLDGRPADVKIPNYQGLHGYVGLGARRMPRFAFGRGLRGLGAEICTDDPTTGDQYCYDDGTGTGGGTGTGPIIDPETGKPILPPLPPSQIPLNSPITPAQAGLTPAQIAQLITATGNASVSLIRTATGGPYTVAGTNLIYNPATGQLTSAANPYGFNLSSLNMSSITSNLPLIGGIVLAALLLPSLLGGRR